MSEYTKTPERLPQDPELLECQIAIKDICDTVLSKKPKGDIFTFWDIDNDEDPYEVQEKLMSIGMGDLLLKDGDSLSSHDSEYYPDLDLRIGSAKLIGTSVRAWGSEYPKKRRGDVGPPYEVFSYPGENDWRRQLDIILVYSNGKELAQQTISVQTSSSQAGRLPHVYRDVWAAAYAETGYEGHDQIYRNAKNDEEVYEFLAIASELISSKTKQDS